MSIVITGASGKLGHLIIEQLLHQISPERIIAGVRRLEAGDSYRAAGIQVRLCDYDQPESIEQAMAGASQLLLISSSHADDTIRFRQHAHVIEAAKRMKVEHLVYTSFAFPEHGSGPPVHLHLATEYAIRASGIAYTFMRNALYTDIIEALDLQTIIAEQQIVCPPEAWTFNTVIRADLAAATANVLAQPSKHRNRIYELTASTSWNFSDLAAALSELVGTPMAVQQDPQLQHWIFNFLRTIDTSSTTTDLEQLLGHPPTSLRDSLQPFITGFNSTNY
ncbi:NAD(P)H-binding protein [Paenibacillus massiliensis]|uniref:NAD(P)H-binding protein n=1 Tax=Paenibacillus massiliensis TaxID=225917 RepID=UPI00046FF85C|nr:NAD(P)H-binding protein [Paenibacillus massiliensis]